MLAHLLKLIWKRKTRNLLLTAEILLAFVLVFAVAAFGTRYYQLYRLPLGFDARNLWSVYIDTANDDAIKADPAAYDKFERSLRALPEVEQLAFSTNALYVMERTSNEFTLPDGSARVDAPQLEVSDGFFALAGMQLVQGRWFSALDDGAAATPVIINRRLAQALFPGRSAVGQQFSDSEADAPSRHMLKVAGVIDEFRDQGEYMTPTYFMLSRFTPLNPQSTPHTILLRLRPGTARGFERTLLARLKAVHNDWAYTIAPESEQRASMLKTQMMPLLVLGVIAAFLLVMVAFGLFGVLWQNTTLRIPEIGLRRAIGADAGHIYRQIIAEQLLLSSVAMLAGLLLLVQLPVTGAFGDELNWPVFVVAAALSMAVIYLLSLLCAVYPGWRASRLSPTEALHYE